MTKTIKTRPTYAHLRLLLMLFCPYLHDINQLFLTLINSGHMWIKYEKDLKRQNNPFVLN